jgi:hypothetical protein
MATSIYAALSGKNYLHGHHDLPAYAQKGTSCGSDCLVNMAMQEKHPKLVNDGRHTAAPCQRTGESISDYTVKWVDFLYIHCLRF